MTGGSVYGGVTYTPVGNKNFNPSFYTYGAGAKGQYEDGSWKWQATVSANFDADRYKKVMAMEEWAKAMTEAGAKPKTFKDYQNAAMAKSLKEAYARQYYEEHWKNQTETERRMDEIDNETELEHTNDMITSRKSVATYSENDEGFEERKTHINYQLGKYGDSIETSLKNNGDYLVLGEKGLGTGQTLTEGDIYDDRITLVMKDNSGKIVIKEFFRANLEATVHDPREGATNNYNTLAGGKYRVESEIWAGKTINYQQGGGDEAYFILRFTSDTYSTKGVKMYGVLEHAGGPEAWDYSHGCQTTNREDYQQFARMFWDSELNSGLGGYRNHVQGNYYLIR
jgi:hypothetical protein